MGRALLIAAILLMPAQMPPKPPGACRLFIGGQDGTIEFENQGGMSIWDHTGTIYTAECKDGVLQTNGVNNVNWPKRIP